MSHGIARKFSFAGSLFLFMGGVYALGAHAVKEIPREHPRLFGSKQELMQLAARRAGAFGRMRNIARRGSGHELSYVFSLCLTYAVEGGDDLARKAISIARDIISRPLKKGHEPFAIDMAIVAIVWDHCYDKLTDDDKKRMIDWVNEIYRININVETHVFFNGYYGYKMWGFGLAGYATWPDNPKAREIIDFVSKDVVERAVPAQQFAGEGGGWPEGYYVHYFLYYWLLYCEAARRLEGIDYYSMAPGFFGQRPVASMFECYPGRNSHNARSMPCWGDGRSGGGYGGDTDMALCVRRILARFFFDKDPMMGYVAAFNRETPSPGAADYSYMDFLWDDADLPAAPLDRMKLAHHATGAGHVYARSSWKDDATWVFFKAGRRLAGHQHLDMGHFSIYKHAVLASDSGEYATFDDSHSINYYMRTIAHNCILVFDPAETFRNMRSGKDGDNDGGQAYQWTGTSMAPNGSARDMRVVEANRNRVDIAEIIAYEDTPLYTYAAADCTKAYSSSKMQHYVRHFLFIRPDNVVVFDYVAAKRPDFEKTWLLHTVNEPTVPGGETMKEPGLFACSGGFFTASNGGGGIVCQTLLPQEHRMTKIGGKGVKDYWYRGRRYAPSSDRDAFGASYWRIEVSPTRPSALDAFLHVIWTGRNNSPLPPPAKLLSESGMLGAEFTTTQGVARVLFDSTGRAGGRIEFYVGGNPVVAQPLVASVVLERSAMRLPDIKRPAQPGKTAEPQKEEPKETQPAGPTEEDRLKADVAASAMRAAVADALRAGKGASIFVSIAGMRTRGRVKNASDEGITVAVAGMDVIVPWDDLSPKEFYALARDLVADHALLYTYCFGVGLADEAEAEKAASGR